MYGGAAPAVCLIGAQELLNARTACIAASATQPALSVVQGQLVYKRGYPPPGFVTPSHENYPSLSQNIFFSGGM